MGYKPIDQERNGTKYAWCQPPGNVSYNWQEHISVALRVIKGAFINFMPPALQDVGSVILTSPDVNVTSKWPALAQENMGQNHLGPLPHVPLDRRLRRELSSSAK